MSGWIDLVLLLGGLARNWRRLRLLSRHWRRLLCLLARFRLLLNLLRHLGELLLHDLHGHANAEHEESAHGDLDGLLHVVGLPGAGRLPGVAEVARRGPGVEV